MSTLVPVQQFLLDVAIILVLARLLGTAFRKIGQPPVVGEIIAGILLGPTLFDGKISTWLFTVKNPVAAPKGSPDLPPVNLLGVLRKRLIGEVGPKLMALRDRVHSTLGGVF